MPRRRSAARPRRRRRRRRRSTRAGPSGSWIMIVLRRKLRPEASFLEKRRSYSKARPSQRSRRSGAGPRVRRRRHAHGGRALEGFSLSVPGGATRAADDASKDVVVKGLSISAPEKPLLVNADLALVAGRRYGLVGANGRGKSTLLRFIAARRLPVPQSVDVLLVDQEASFQGASVLEDVLAADATRSSLLAEEAALWRDIDGGNTAAAERLAAVCDELEAIDADAAEGRAQAVLAGLGFSEAMVAGPASKLSGGWRVRAALARALFAPPSLLLLDEPTNHLDLDAVLWLERYITDQLPASSTLLTVSHDRGFLDETSTDLINLSDDGGLEAHRGGLAKLDAGAKARLAKRTKDYALQQKTLKEERSKHPSLRAEKLEQRVLEKLGAPRLVEKPREYAVHFDLRAPDDARSAAGCGIDLRGVAFSFGATSTGFGGFKDLVDCERRRLDAGGDRRCQRLRQIDPAEAHRRRTRTADWRSDAGPAARPGLL